MLSWKEREGEFQLWPVSGYFSKLSAFTTGEYEEEQAEEGDSRLPPQNSTGPVVEILSEPQCRRPPAEASSSGVRVASEAARVTELSTQRKRGHRALLKT